MYEKYCLIISIHLKALVEKCRQIVTVEFNESPHISDTAFRALYECKLVKMKIEG